MSQCSSLQFRRRYPFIQLQETISDWAYMWKMQFNPDKTKQAVQDIFSQKKIKPVHPPIYFSNTEVTMYDQQTHLGLILDSILTFHSHIKDKTIKSNRGIGMMRYLLKNLTCDVLDQLHRIYVRPHLDYGDIIYHRNDPDFRLDFTNKLEAIQYSTALPVSGAWHGTNRQKLHEELGWKSLYHRRWYRRLTHFYKLKNTQSPLYLYSLIPAERGLRYNLRMPHPYDPQTERFSNTYFQNCI